MTESTSAAVDLAVLAYRDEGRGNLGELPDHVDGDSLNTVETIAEEVRRHLGDNGALAGEPAIVEDPGIFAQDLAAPLDDHDLPPADLPGDVAATAGSGPEFDEPAGSSQ